VEQNKFLVNSKPLNLKYLVKLVIGEYKK